MIYYNELSNIDIEKIIKHYNLNDYFGGVFSKDNLPNKLIKGKYYIINLNNHNQSGSHWTCFYYNYPLYSIYYDSYGYPAPLEVQNKIKPYIFNDVDIQDYNSRSCGYYCISFIKFLYNKQNKYNSFDTYINLFSNDTMNNDKILYNYICQYP